MIVYLVRHGLSKANVARLVTGTPADGLVDEGRRQAEALGAWLRGAGVVPDRYLVSHWGRARQTADLLFPGAPWVVDERLGETDAGSAADMSLESFLESWPDFYGSHLNCYPAGESHQQLHERVANAWADLRKSDANVVLAVTHSGPISCLLQQMLGIAMDRFPAFLPSHASVSILESGVPSGSGDPSFRLRGFSAGPLPFVPTSAAAVR